jgi:hypothetical protein
MVLTKLIGPARTTAEIFYSVEAQLRVVSLFGVVWGRSIHVNRTKPRNADMRNQHINFLSTRMLIHRSPIDTTRRNLVLSTPYLCSLLDPDSD